MTATLLAPYFIIEQNLLGGTSVWIVAPLWSFVFHSGAAFFFEFPLGLTIDYLPFWGMGLILSGVTFFSITREDLTRLGYAIVVFILLLMQLGYFVVIGYLTSSGPLINITPIPIVAVLALFLTPIIIRAPSSSWEPGSSS
ncbi:MAG: hypothetical protein ACXABV_17740 [Candidatus Thorarchaeota archaeon]|jgi:hypothetical protein